MSHKSGLTIEKGPTNAPTSRFMDMDICMHMHVLVFQHEGEVFENRIPRLHDLDWSTVSGVLA